MISEIFMLEEDGSWWIDSCASRHVYKERSLFKTFETVKDGCVLFMGNFTIAAMKGKGTVNLEFTSENVLISLMFIMFLKLGRTSCLEVFLINLVLSVSLSQISLC
jgi:hypothetical protein